jgi:hypothetical protein
MDQIAAASSRRTDEQLLFMIDQTAEWTVNGRAGAELALFGSLREALKAVFRYEADRIHVFAVCHRGDDVVVFREQVERLADADGRIEPEFLPSEAAWPTLMGAAIHRQVPAGKTGAQ